MKDRFWDVVIDVWIAAIAAVGTVGMVFDFVVEQVDKRRQ